MNLLIVDDHLINLKLLRAQLESEGHTVFEAHDGVDALALLERQRVDAVISDILMPRMDGYRLCHEIRKHARLRDLPIIIYTATYISPGDEKLAFDMGANKYLMKPVSVEILIAALHEVIAQPHAAPRADALREIVVLKEYNERLVSKLKEKNTELQAQTEVLHKSHEDYRRVIEDIFKFVPEALLVFTGNLNLFKDNQAFEDLLRTHAPKLNYTEPELRETLLQEIRAKVLSGDAGEIRIPPKNRDEQGTRGPDHSGEGAEPAAPPIPGLS